MSAGAVTLRIDVIGRRREKKKEEELEEEEKEEEWGHDNVTEGSTSFPVSWLKINLNTFV